MSNGSIMQQEAPVSGCAIVILGASGDLARRKLIPALHALFRKGSIGPGCVIIGSGRTPFSDEAFREWVGARDEFASILSYHQHLHGLKKAVSQKGSFRKVVFFLALPPPVYAQTAEALVEEGFGDEACLIIEKPFGSDYDSSRQLNDRLKRCFDESRIFRIDHYLAKEAVQNLLVFRFANSLFYPIWNSRYVESIQISALETLGVGERGAYFDSAGIIRDMVQNHLMQLLCLLTMEAPVNLDAEEIRAQKMNVLKTIRVDEVHRFQYQGYRSEKKVTPESTTETFAEMRLWIDNFRWTGTPVYIRTGKAMHRRGTEIGMRFRSLPRLLFNQDGQIPANQIVFKMQPAEGIILDLSSKMPGADLRIVGTTMNFCYRDCFEQEVPEAYQKLLLDALQGNRTLFVGAEETELSWKLFESVLDQGRLSTYEKGVHPPSQFGIDWIDFDRYASICA